MNCVCPISGPPRSAALFEPPGLVLGGMGPAGAQPLGEPLPLVEEQPCGPGTVRHDRLCGGSETRHVPSGSTAVPGASGTAHRPVSRDECAPASSSMPIRSGPRSRTPRPPRSSAHAAVTTSVGGAPRSAGSAANTIARSATSGRAGQRGDRRRPIRGLRRRRRAPPPSRGVAGGPRSGQAAWMAAMSGASASGCLPGCSSTVARSRVHSVRRHSARRLAHPPCPCAGCVPDRQRPRDLPHRLRPAPLHP